MMATYQGAARSAGGASLFANKAAASSSSHQHLDTFVTPALPLTNTGGTSTSTERMAYEAAPTPSGLSQLAHLLDPLPPSPTVRSAPSSASTRRHNDSSSFEGASTNSQYNHHHHQQRKLYPRSSPTALRNSPQAAGSSTSGSAQQGQPRSQRNSASASQSDSGSIAGSRAEVSSPFEGSEDDDDDEDEEDGDEDLVEEDAPIDWSAIDANAFFQSWLLPGSGGGVQDRGQSTEQRVSTNDFTNAPLLHPQQMFTPNGSMAPPDYSLYQPQHQQHQETHAPPAAPSPNLSAAIEILTKVLGEGQEVPSQVLEMLLQSVAPTFGYQPPTPSQEPGIDSLVPILKDLIKKQQQQEQQQQQQTMGKLGGVTSSVHEVAGSSSSFDGRQQSWSNTTTHARAGAAPSPLPNISFNSLTPNPQTFSWVPLATPADEDEEDDEDKDPSYNPTPLAGERGRNNHAIQDALEEQVSQYLNSPFTVTPTGALSTRPSPLPSTASHLNKSTLSDPSMTASVRSSPRRAQAVHNGPFDEASGSYAKQSKAAGSYAAPDSPTPDVNRGSGSLSRFDHRGDARKRATDLLQSEATDKYSNASASRPNGSTSTARGVVRTIQKKRSRCEDVCGSDEGEYGEEERGSLGRRRLLREPSPLSQKPKQSSRRQSSPTSVSKAVTGALRRHDGDVEDDRDAGMADAMPGSPSRSPSPEGADETASPLKKPSNAGRKPVYETEEERKARRAAQNRKNQQQWRARKRAEKESKVGTVGSRGAGGVDDGGGSATGRALNKISLARATATANGFGSIQQASTTPSTLLEDEQAQLRDDFEDLREENADLKAEQRLLRAEMERLRRENLDLRVEVEVARRLRGVGGGGGGSSSASVGNGNATRSETRGASSSRRYGRRSEGATIPAGSGDRRFRSSYRRSAASTTPEEEDDVQREEEEEEEEEGEEDYDGNFPEVEDRRRRRPPLSEDYSEDGHDEDDGNDDARHPNYRRWIDDGPGGRRAVGPASSGRRGAAKPIGNGSGSGSGSQSSTRPPQAKSKMDGRATGDGPATSSRRRVRNFR